MTAIQLTDLTISWPEATNATSGESREYDFQVSGRNESGEVVRLPLTQSEANLLMASRNFGGEIRHSMGSDGEDTYTGFRVDEEYGN